MPSPPFRRGLVAALAGAAVLVGALTMLAGLVAMPGPWTAGYVSEAGTTGMPLAGAYRWGLLGLALGVALLGRALRPGSRPVATLLIVAAGLAACSGAVPCSGGCPLPPYEPTTVADVTHTAASVAGMVALAGAMAVVALRAPFDAASRRLAAVALVVTVPLGAVLGSLMLFAGRGPLSAALERVLLVVAVSWLIGTSVVAATAGRARSGPRTGRRAAEAGREDRQDAREPGGRTG